MSGGRIRVDVKLQSSVGVGAGIYDLMILFQPQVGDLPIRIFDGLRDGRWPRGGVKISPPSQSTLLISIQLSYGKGT